MIYEVRDVCFKYPHTDRVILNNVCLELRRGEILSILGPNGAGKSTMLNCMAKLLQPDAGEIYLCGDKLSRLSYKQAATRISYVQQTHTPAFAYSVMDFVLMGRAPQIGMFRRPGKADEEIAFSVLEDLGIAHLANKPYTDISGGERQQATIARAVVQEPKAVLFDEPTAHLDYGNQYKILKMIRKMAAKNYAVIITTHNPDHAILLGGKAAILDRTGKLVFGDAEKIITEERLKEVYHTELKLLKVEELERIACLPPKL
ncbi:MAG: ABC transporter ATP-binding protein [Firmicutes bacterium]|nr:ABC transporter ATP-binding protein [Bacillota bacterium]